MLDEGFELRTIGLEAEHMNQLSQLMNKSDTVMHIMSYKGRLTHHHSPLEYALRWKRFINKIHEIRVANALLGCHKEIEEKVEFIE